MRRHIRTDPHATDWLVSNAGGWSISGNPNWRPERQEIVGVPELLERLLGPYLEVLRTGFQTRGATSEERRARVFLAVVLCWMGSNHAAARLIFEREPTPQDLRKLGDLRRRLLRGEYPELRVVEAQRALIKALGR